MMPPVRLMLLSACLMLGPVLTQNAAAQRLDPKAPLPSREAVNAQFSSSAELRRYRQQLESSQEVRQQQATRVAQLERDVAGLSAQEQAARTRLESVQTSIATLENQKLEVEEQIRDTQGKIVDLESQIALTEAQVARQRAALNRLVLRMYRDRGGQFVKLIARAETLHDALLRSEYASRLSRRDLEQISELKGSLERLDSQKRQMVALTERLNGLQRRLIGQLDALRSQRQTQQQAIALLSRSVAGRSALLLETAQAQSRTEAQVRTLLGNIGQEKGRLEQARQARLREIEQEQARRVAEAKRIAAEQARIARLKAEAEARRVAEEKRLAEERRRLEQARVLAEQRRMAEEKRLAEQRREQARQQQIARQAEQRREQARMREELRLVGLRREELQRQQAVRRAKARQEELARQEADRREAARREDARRLEQAEAAEREARRVRENEVQAAAQRAETARAEAQRLEREEQALKAREQQLERQQAEAQREEQAVRSSVRVPSAFGGRLGFPMPGGHVSSGFNGAYVLISGGEGAAVQASGPGVVIQSAFYAAQGGVILIEHSSGLSSMYFGIQSATVARGSQVSAGQVIGYAGGAPSFGTDTIGYQVLVGGSAINPL